MRIGQALRITMSPFRQPAGLVADEMGNRGARQTTWLTLLFNRMAVESRPPNRNGR